MGARAVAVIFGHDDPILDPFSSKVPLFSLSSLGEPTIKPWVSSYNLLHITLAYSLVKKLGLCMGSLIPA